MRRCAGASVAQSREKPSAKQIATLGIVHGVQFVEHDGSSVSRTSASAFARGKQKRELFRRREQDVGRRCASGAGGVAVEVSPVRVSMRMGRPISATGVFEIARDVDRERFQRRNIERVHARWARRLLRGELRCEFDQAGQKSRQRLAAARRRDEQHGLARACGMFDQRELMRPRRPAARGEPRSKTLRKGLGDLGHDVHGRTIAGPDQNENHFRGGAGVS